MPLLLFPILVLLRVPYSECRERILRLAVDAEMLGKRCEMISFKPKKNFFKLKNAKNLEKITRIFFNQRRKMIKKPYNFLFNGNLDIQERLNLNLSLRPQNLDFETYYNLAKEYENL